MKPNSETNTASLAVIGVDIGKEVFHIVGLGVDGKIAFRRKVKRLGLKDAFEKLPPCHRRATTRAAGPPGFIASSAPARKPR
jgi:hypothetical protein